MHFSSLQTTSARHAEPVSETWLVRLRTVFMLGGTALVLGVELYAGRLPEPRLAALLALALASNGLVWLWARAGRPRENAVLTLVFCLDILLITGVLGLTGGASNPFSSAYLLPVAVGALLLPLRFAWVVVGLAVLDYGLLVWLDDVDQHHGHESMRLHVLGMWVAFLVVGPMVAWAVTRLRLALADAEQRLADSRQQQERTQKLAALATLSAGAAHELSTPLATIAVVARELERRRLDPELTEDARLIRSEIDRCSEILSQLAADVGAGSGEAAVALRVSDLVDDLLDGADGVRLDAEPAILGRVITVPRYLCTRALRGLMKNARQASAEGDEVELHVSAGSSRLRLEIHDRGCGMDAEARERAGEPFFTTKAVGEGMGLGIFFARSVIEHLGGELDIESERGRGTQVRVSLPFGAAMA